MNILLSSKYSEAAIQLKKICEMHENEEDRAEKAEKREQKLKEAVEIAIRDGGKYENPYESLIYLQSVLASLYPSNEKGIN